MVRDAGFEPAIQTTRTFSFPCSLLNFDQEPALPAIWDALRISLGWAWTWLVLAELVAATSGLGYRIVVSQRYFRTDTIIGYILLLGFLGLFTDQIMRSAERILFRYNWRRA